MLSGTSRRPDNIVGVVPPNLVECSVEKIAINAVLAGCLPQYLPVVLAQSSRPQDKFVCTDCWRRPIFQGPW